MLTWLSANLINIVLIAALVLIVGMLIRGMVRDRKAGKRSCGGNCAACSGCSACGRCGAVNAASSAKKARAVKKSCKIKVDSAS